MTPNALPECGILVSKSDSDTCLLAFAAHYHPAGMPPFELLQVTDGLPVLRVLLRDLDQVCYQRGIRGLGDSIASTTEALRALLDEHGITRAVCFGNSAGGFAAIMFGSLLGADSVYAFAPQTNQTGEFHDRHLPGYAKWSKQSDEFWADPPEGPILDLRPVVEASGVPIHLYYTANNSHDVAQAENLAGLPNVTFYRRDGNHHALARIMRDSGELRELLLTSIR